MAFATYMLKANAGFWWTGTQRLLESTKTHITWDVFKTTFYDMYFLASVRNTKKLEFMRL